MSLLSQFFPSGQESGNIGETSKGLAKDYSNQIPVDLILIGGGGGGGGLPSGPLTPTPSYVSSVLCSVVTGGGGAGRAVTYTAAVVNTGVAYPITVGAGGASGAAGGSSCFGILIAGGGGAGAGTDPLGNPVAASNASAVNFYAGSGGGGGFNQTTTMPAGGISGFNQLCATIQGLTPSLILTCTKDGNPAVGPISQGFRWSGAGAYGPNTDITPMFTQWGLPAYIGVGTFGKCSVTTGFDQANFVCACANPDGAPLVNIAGNAMYACYTNSTIVCAPCWYFDWTRINFAFNCNTAPVPINNNPQYPIRFGPGALCDCSCVFSLDSQPLSFTGISVRVDTTDALPLAVSCIIPNLTSPCMCNVNKSSLYQTVPADGSPGTGSGGNGGLRVQPAPTAQNNYTLLKPVRIVCVSTCCDCTRTVTCPYGVSFPGFSQSGGAGGSGSVWVIYPTDYAAATVTGNTPVPSPPAIRVYRWDGAGTITFN